jgi:hypothetical protein
MARMKTGRLTTKTTPPQKPSVSTKPGVSNVSNQGEWDKYGADYNANKNYGNEVKAYQEKKKVYDESKLKAPKSYALFGGKQNTRSLAGSELADFNKKTGSNYSKVEVSKDLKKVGEKDMFFGEMEKPTAPTKREQPKVPELTGTMNILKPEPIKTRKSGIKKLAEEVNEKQDFVSPGKPIRRGKSPDMNLFAKGATTKGSGKRYVKQVIGSIGKTGDNSRGYKREEKLFKAKASTGAANLDISDMSSKEIKGIRKDYLRADLKEARRDVNSTPESKAKKIAAAKMEIKQSRQGQRYTTKMEKGKLSYFTPGYNEGKNKNEEPINKRGRIAEYKESLNNAANRNTIDKKLEDIGAKAKKRSTVGSYGQMPL